MRSINFTIESLTNYFSDKNSLISKIAEINIFKDIDRSKIEEILSTGKLVFIESRETLIKLIFIYTVRFQNLSSV